MRSTFKKLLCALPALALITGAVVMDFSSYARAAEKEAALSETQKAEIRQIIKDYILSNPEVVIESFKIYQEKQQQESMAASENKIEEYKAQLTAKDAPSIGNPDGDVTVIEFFDYNCGYCKKAIGDIQNILNEDKNVRFVFFDMPILGPSSLTAAQWAYAAHKQGKYFEYHTALMQHNGAIDENVLTDIAKKAGLDVEKAKQDAGSAEIAQAVNKGAQMGHDIGIQGTPGFIVNGQLYPGYLGEQGLKDAIKAARSGKKS